MPRRLSNFIFSFSYVAKSGFMCELTREFSLCHFVPRKVRSPAYEECDLHPNPSNPWRYPLPSFLALLRLGGHCLLALLCRPGLEGFKGFRLQEVRAGLGCDGEAPKASNIISFKQETGLWSVPGRHKQASWFSVCPFRPGRRESADTSRPADSYIYLVPNFFYIH